MKLAWLSLLLGVMLLGTIGCEDDRPIYKAPQLTASETVTLRGGWGTYIEEVDGARVSDASMMFSNWGGDVVTVEPGTHHLHIVNNYSSASVNRVERWFDFRCEAGHTYDFTPKALWQPGRLMVTDKNTGQQMTIDLPEKDKAFMMSSD